MNKKTTLILLSIMLLGLGLRLIGLNWDQGQHLHPDERFLTMVLSDIKIPQNLIEYLNPKLSPLNPYNQNYSFFVYGSFPVNIVKFLGQALNLNSYDQIYLVGRYVTVFLDLLIILVIYLISIEIYNDKVGLLAAFFYSISVLPVQLSHFYTVDPFLNFFIITTFYLLILLKNKTKKLLKIILLSLIFGIALACKISAVYFLPVIFIFFIHYFYKKPLYFLFYGLVFVVTTLFSLRLNQPQIFSSGNFFNWRLNPQFVENIVELKNYSNNQYYPPSIQWLKVTPLVFPLNNIILWGLGLPLGIIFVFSIFLSSYLLLKKGIKGSFYLFIILFWIVFLIVYQGTQFVTTMRYFLPIYPFIAILSATSLTYLIKVKVNLKNNKIYILTIVILLVYPLSFISIYLKDHTRVTASKWIYQNISIGSRLATEHWDDALPLSIGESNYGFYQMKEIPVADPDNEEKISKINNIINGSDYIIFSSNRFYIPIPQNSELFPLTTEYYESIFNNKMGFTKVAEFNSYPCFPPIGKPLFCINDTNSEEAFTVYDHPKVLIYKKND